MNNLKKTSLILGMTFLGLTIADTFNEVKAIHGVSTEVSQSKNEIPLIVEAPTHELSISDLVVLSDGTEVPLLELRESFLPDIPEVSGWF